jgi:VIT1/CCC1 family predicted Fe2+/Mn2+ transporter
MIVLGVILLILGFVFGIHLLWVLGIILLVIGAILWIMGSVGRPIAGRRHYF